jgi:hypothetical protein
MRSTPSAISSGLARPRDRLPAEGQLPRWIARAAPRLHERPAEPEIVGLFERHVERLLERVVHVASTRHIAAEKRDDGIGSSRAQPVFFLRVFFLLAFFSLGPTLSA